MEKFIIIKKEPAVELSTYIVEAESESQAILLVVNKKVEPQNVITYRQGDPTYDVDHADRPHEIGGSE